jgi:starch phosphorylase
VPASLLAADFAETVLEHLVHTCAKDPRDASALDLYHAFAHTVRDHLVRRWLATQRTHFERDVKRACYLSSEFLTGRSLGLCPMNMGLYDVACFMDALATLELPAIGYGIRYDFGMFEQRIDSGQQVERHDNWLHLGNTRTIAGARCPHRAFLARR